VLVEDLRSTVANLQSGAMQWYALIRDARSNKTTTAKVMQSIQSNYFMDSHNTIHTFLTLKVQNYVQVRALRIITDSVTQ
jgi:hypothetical protein